MQMFIFCKQERIPHPFLLTKRLLAVLFILSMSSCYGPVHSDSALHRCFYDDYDRLIQLCDSIAMVNGVVDLKTRMDDVERRYGYYPENK